MQQRQPRLGDILDDYCPRERRLTNHVVVAMIGDAVKQTRCSTCESDHAYRHAAIPRQRKKSEESLLYAQVLAGVTPKKPFSQTDREADVPTDAGEDRRVDSVAAAPSEPTQADPADALFVLPDDEDAHGNREDPVEEGPLHRRLIRAQLPRHEGQTGTMRQPTDFTIRQPTPPRAKRFGGRHPRGPGVGGGGAQFQGNRQGGTGNGPGNTRGGGGFGGGSGGSGGGGGAARPGGRPPGGGPRPNNRQGGGGRNRPK